MNSSASSTDISDEVEDDSSVLYDNKRKKNLTRLNKYKKKRKEDVSASELLSLNDNINSFCNSNKIEFIPNKIKQKNFSDESDIDNDDSFYDQLAGFFLININKNKNKSLYFQISLCIKFIRKHYFFNLKSPVP